jgi:hypothetical protein
LPCVAGWISGAHEAFSTLHVSLRSTGKNSRLTALKQLPLQLLRFDGRRPRKIFKSRLQNPSPDTE